MLVSCAHQVAPPPELRDDATAFQRRAVYDNYRVQAVSDDRVRRRDGVFHVNQLKGMSRSCEGAARLYPAPPSEPYLLMGIGAALAVFGLSGAVFDGPTQDAGVDNIDVPYSAVGGGVFALGALAALLMTPETPPAPKFVAAYNDCLQQTLDVDPDASVIGEPIPPAAEAPNMPAVPNAPSSVDRTGTTTATTTATSTVPE